MREKEGRVYRGREGIAEILRKGRLISKKLEEDSIPRVKLFCNLINWLRKVKAPEKNLWNRHFGFFPVEYESSVRELLVVQCN